MVHSHRDAGGAVLVLYGGTSRVRVVTGDRPAVREFLHTFRFDAVLDCYRTRVGAIAAGSRTEFVSHAKALWDVNWRQRAPRAATSGKR